MTGGSERTRAGGLIERRCFVHRQCALAKLRNQHGGQIRCLVRLAHRIEILSCLDELIYGRSAVGCGTSKATQSVTDHAVVVPQRGEYPSSCFTGLKRAMLHARENQRSSSFKAVRVRHEHSSSY